MNAVKLGLFNGYKVGTCGGCEVSMFQFADDTVFVGEASIQNVVVLKVILRCFELSSGLKVNFNKSKLASTTVEPDFERRIAAVLNCKIMATPFVYLGIPIGARPDCRRTWDPVIAMFRSRLSSWRLKTVSFGGRICLVQSVLSALPLFYLSFFKIPSCVVKDCTIIMRNFLWGGGEEDRKIAWVKWSKEPTLPGSDQDLVIIWQSFAPSNVKGFAWLPSFIRISFCVEYLAWLFAVVGL
ncbi:uncharacterized protein LOC130737348 [Lotus japonicus]|uniref:uncharacterized protein LOC130737348 n=1 Tax=Lotus japonicus TaxID=34305 RepID=UPI0025879BBC|nr:uncharacterized protein LOC130737348 [Lotus japonicus]